LAHLELDKTLGLTGMDPGALECSRLASYEGVIDAERLWVDPAMRHVVGGRASQPEKQAASTSEVGCFETKTLSTKSNPTD